MRYNLQDIINMAGNLLPGVQDKNTKEFKGALILKHPKRYPLEKLDLDNIELLESTDFGLNTISFFIVKP